MSEELPEGWTTAPLDTLLIDAQNGLSARSGDGVPTVVLRLADVSIDGTFASDGLREIPLSERDRSKYSLIPGDLLVFRVNGSASIAGRVVCYPGPTGHAYCDHFIRFRVDRTNLEPRFLAMAFKTPAVRAEIERQMVSSAGQNTVSQATLRGVDLPIAPLPEQHRIVERVDALLEQVNRANARLDRVPLILKRFRQAVLAAACCGRLTETWRARNAGIPPATQVLEEARQSHTAVVRRGVPEVVGVPDELSNLELPSTWAIASTAALLRTGVLTDVKDGNHGANHPRAADFTTRGLPFITAAQVANYHISYEAAPKVSGEALKRLRVGFAKPGDAILTHKGSVGRAAVNTQECVLTPQTTYYRCDHHVIDARYLVYYFTSFHFFSQLAAVMSQTTRDFVPISEQYRLFLVLPPIGEQLEIVRRVDELFALADAVSSRVDTAAARADKLPEAILTKAFAGELVFTEAELARAEGREYETASALLERLRSPSPAVGRARRGSGATLGASTATSA